MKQPDISFYGQATGRFPIYLQTIKLLDKIRNGEVPATRSMCYSADLLSTEFLGAVADRLDIALSVLKDTMEMEIYCPDRRFPAHTDEGKLSFMIPLDEGCTATIDGVTHYLEPWGIYSFHDGKPHATTGGMLMMKGKTKFLA